MKVGRIGRMEDKVTMMGDDDVMIWSIFTIHPSIDRSICVLLQVRKALRQ